MAEIERVAPRRFKEAIDTPSIDTSDRFLDGLSKVAGVTKGLTASFDASTEKLNIEHEANVEKIAKDRLKQAYNFEQGLDVDDDATEAGKQYHAILSANNAFNTEMDNAMFKASDIAKGNLDAVEVLNEARLKALEQINPDIVQDSTYNKLMTSMFERGASRLNSAVRVNKKALFEMEKANEVMKSLSKRDIQIEDINLSMKVMDKYDYDNTQQLALISGAVKSDLGTHPEKFKMWKDFRPFGEDQGTLADIDPSVTRALNAAAHVVSDNSLEDNYKIELSLETRWVRGEDKDTIWPDIKTYRDKDLPENFGISEADIRRWDNKRALFLRDQANKEDFMNRIIANSETGGVRVGEEIPDKEHKYYSSEIVKYIITQPRTSGMNQEDQLAEVAKMHSLSLVKSDNVQALRDISQLTQSQIEGFDEENLRLNLISYSNYDNAYKAKYFSDKDAAVLDAQSVLLQNGSGTSNKIALANARKALSDPVNLAPNAIVDVVKEAMSKNDIDSDNRAAYDYIFNRASLMLKSGYKHDDLIHGRISGDLALNTIMSEDGESLHVGNLQRVAGKRGLNIRQDKVALLLEQASWAVGRIESRDPGDYATATWTLDDKTGKAYLNYGDGSPSNQDINIKDLNDYAAAGREMFLNDPDFDESVMSIGTFAKFFEKAKRSINSYRDSDKYVVRTSPSLLSTPLSREGFRADANGRIGFNSKVDKDGTITVDGIKLDPNDSQFGFREAEKKHKEDMETSSKVNTKDLGRSYTHLTKRIQSYLDTVGVYESEVLKGADMKEFLWDNMGKLSSPDAFFHEQWLSSVKFQLEEQAKRSIKDPIKKEATLKRLDTIYYNIF